VYECDVDDDVIDDVTDASEQFDDMMRNLGAVGLLEKLATATIDAATAIIKLPILHEVYLR